MGTALATRPASKPPAIALPSFSDVRQAHYDFSGEVTTDTELAELLKDATKYAVESRAKGTRANYDSAYNAQILPFCAAHNVLPYPMPPALVGALFVHIVEGGRESGRERTSQYLSMVRHTLSLLHTLQDLPDPTLTPKNIAVFHGLVKKYGLKSKHPKIAIYPGEVAKMMPLASAHLIAVRGLFHCAVLAIGSGGAMRSAEARDLDVPDLKFDSGGVTVVIAKSKTDQYQVGREIYIQRTKSPHSDPVLALEVYLDEMGAKTGPLFRGGLETGGFSGVRACTRTLRRVVKEYAMQLGLDAATVGYHSLRAGFITAGIDAKIELHLLMEMTGHASYDSLMRYYRPRFRASPNLSEAVGL
jgi:integrase